MNKQFERYLKGTLLLLDLLVLNISNFSLQGFFVTHFDQTYINAYNRYFLVCNVIWVMITFLLTIYNIKIVLDFNNFLKRTFQAFLLYGVLLLFYLFFVRELIVSRQFILYSILTFAVSVALIRFLFLGFLYYFKNSENLRRRVMILGYNELAIQLADYIEKESPNIKLVGFVENTENIHELTNYPVLGNIDHTLEIAKDFGVKEIYSTILPEFHNQVYDLMQRSEKGMIKFKIVPDLKSLFQYTSHLEFYGNIPILSRRISSLDDAGNIIKKRILDVTVSSLVLLFILSWLVPLLGLVIIIDSGFPVFFKQKRTGISNKPFMCLKFRSMKKNKDADKKQATAHDARITRVGAFIRKTSLDEFPQFINVLKGDMSLVGPRPHMLKHTDDYSKIVDEFMVRQFIKPGITGWAQIHGLRGEIKSIDDIRNRVEKDIWYMEHWTLWLDIQILFLTVYNIFRGDKNAY